MGASSRNKGQRGERELAAYLETRGYPARRGQQYRDGPGSPYLVCLGLPFYFEVKRCEKLRLHDALAQAIVDAGDGLTPIVAHRRNRGDWLAVMRQDDLLTLVNV